MATETKCPFITPRAKARSNRDWWPNQLKLRILHQHSSLSDPMGRTSTMRKHSRASTWQR
jgi:catalase-peroxidase